MDYKLLRFIPEYRMIDTYISHNRIASYMISNTKSAEEYEYQGFENDYHSLDKVLSHAVAMLNNLERNNADEAARLSLGRDYSNAIKCMLAGKNANNEKLDLFTEYMIFEEWNTAVNVLKKAYSENQLINDFECPDYHYIPDYGIMFITAADNALFVEKNPEKAIIGYKIAAYEWKSKGIRVEKNRNLSVDVKHKVNSYIELYLSIKDGMPYNGSLSFLCEYEKKIIETYQVIESKYNQHETAVEEIEKLIGEIENFIKKYPFTGYQADNPIFNDDNYNTLRVICFLVPTLYRFGLLDEVKLLSDEKKLPSDSIKEEALKKIEYLHQSEYDWILRIIPRINERKRWRILSAISQVEDDIKRIKGKLLIKGNVPKLAYYTSWETLSYMLPTDDSEKDIENVGKFSVMHYSYMNDPMEGNVINDFLEIHDDSERKEYLDPYVFVKCFTKSIDYLPMWKMYGNNAEGCCIVIDWNKIKEINKGKHIELYKVCYLTKQRNSYKFIKADNNNDKSLDGLGEILNKLKTDIQSLKEQQEKWNLTGLMLGKLAYLFKDSSYSYEEEARILYTLNKQNSRIEKTNQSPPKLYVHTDYRIAIDEVILGPKFKETYLWMPFIKLQLEKMNEIVGQGCSTKLSISNINYR